MMEIIFFFIILLSTTEVVISSGSNIRGASHVLPKSSEIDISGPFVPITQVLKQKLAVNCPFVASTEPPTLSSTDRVDVATYFVPFKFDEINDAKQT